MVFAWLGKQKNKKFIGIEVRENGIAVAQRQDTPEGIVLNHVDYMEIDTDRDFGPALTEIVKKRSLQGQSCNLVLDPASYQLLLVDAPDVPDEEMRDAIRWRLRDLITMPVEQAAIDIFDVPADSSVAKKRMLYVVITRRDLISIIIKKVNNVGLKLQSIDISELALRNIANQFVDPQFDGRGVAIARIRQGTGTICIFKMGNLYLSRQFDLDYNGGLLDELPTEKLALELQRSLDYYERQMAQVAPGVVYICGDNVSESKVTQELQQNMVSIIQYLELSAAVRTKEEFDSGLMQLCLAASGASFRNDEVASAAG